MVMMREIPCMIAMDFSIKNYFDRFGGYEIAEMQDALLHELDEFMDESSNLTTLQ